MMLINFLLLCLYNVVQCHYYPGYEIDRGMKWSSDSCRGQIKLEKYSLSECVDSCTANKHCKAGWYDTIIPFWRDRCILCTSFTPNPALVADGYITFIREGPCLSLSPPGYWIAAGYPGAPSCADSGGIPTGIFRTGGQCCQPNEDPSQNEVIILLEEMNKNLTNELKVIKDATKKTCEYGCCEIAGCFYLYPSSQCFCYWELEDKDMTWESAKDACLAAGQRYEKHVTIDGYPVVWRLPHPTDAVALRSILVQECGNCDNLWLNAKFEIAPSGLGQTGMLWMDTIYDTQSVKHHLVEITAANPLLKSNFGGFTSGDCLQLAVTETAWDTDGNRPYRVHQCNNANTKVVLCEREIRTMGHKK